jgi:hypothetical protein
MAGYILNILFSPIYRVSWTGAHNFNTRLVLRCGHLYSRQLHPTLNLSYGLDARRFESRTGLGNFVFTTSSRPALGPTQPPIQWVPEALSLRVKLMGREADNSPPSSAKVKKASSYTSTPPIRLHGVVLS